MAAHSPSPSPPPLPWLAWTPGERVVVMYRGEEGPSEALGTLLSTDPHGVVIDTRRGQVRIHASTMITGRKVPTAAPPKRR